MRILDEGVFAAVLVGGRGGVLPDPFDVCAVGLVLFRGGADGWSERRRQEERTVASWRRRFILVRRVPGAKAPFVGDVDALDRTPGLDQIDGVHGLAAIDGFGERLMD